MRNSFSSVGHTPRIIESSPVINFNPLLAVYHLLPDRNDIPQQISVEVLSSLSLDNAYMQSTSPYDDDGGEWVRYI